MQDVRADTNLVAYCGLYCGACGSYLKGRCPGCHENTRATWCRVRSCCQERGCASCADCRDYPDPNGCRHFNNIFSKVMSFVFNSDRRAGVLTIRDIGLGGYAALMAERRIHALPRRGGRSG